MNAVKAPQYAIDAYMSKKYPAEADSLRAPLSMLFDHIDYIVRLIGVDHVGLGSDFDGIESSPRELDDVTTYPIITRELLKRGYKPADVEKILGGNFIRVLKANEVGTGAAAATRVATPQSHGARESRTQSERADFTSTRNVA